MTVYIGIIVGIIIGGWVAFIIFCWALSFISDLFRLGITRPVIEALESPDNSPNKKKIEFYAFEPASGDQAEKFFRTDKTKGKFSLQ